MLITFFNDAGMTVNMQVITPEAMNRLPVVAAAAEVSRLEGPESAADFLRKITMDGF